MVDDPHLCTVGDRNKSDHGPVRSCGDIAQQQKGTACRIASRTSKVLALVGGLRAASVNRQVAQQATEVAPDGVTVTVFDGVGELPFYNEAIDNADVPLR